MVIESKIDWGSRDVSGKEYYHSGLCISVVARLDCAEPKVCYLMPRNADL